jgi:hypothetical protein
MGKTLRNSITAALLLTGITTGVQGQVPGGGFSGLGVGGRGMINIRGTVLCAGCGLDEVRKGQPDQHHLYQLTHGQEQIVMQVSLVNGSKEWNSLQPTQLHARAKDDVFQLLTAEENMGKEVEITGILRTTRTLDIATVTISG